LKLGLSTSNKRTCLYVQCGQRRGAKLLVSENPHASLVSRERRTEWTKLH